MLRLEIKMTFEININMSVIMINSWINGVILSHFLNPGIYLIIGLHQMGYVNQ